MKWFKKVLVIFLLLLFAGSLYPEAQDRIYIEKKDPFIAGLLSVTMMGLGHFYTRDYLEGSLFVLTDLLQKGMIVFLISNFSDKYTDKETDDNVVRWSEMSDTDQGVVVGFIVFMLFDPSFR